MKVEVWRLVVSLGREGLGAEVETLRTLRTLRTLSTCSYTKAFPEYDMLKWLAE
jgi:hypothetical protein